MPWVPAFLGCFLGIWLGDALLYACARGIGRPLLEKSWFRRWITPEAVARSEAWFARRGTWLLVSSRFVPGTRLPTYVAAGFLRLPFMRFLLVTGLTVALWTAGLFLLAQWLGVRLVAWMEGWASGAVSLIVVLLLLLLLTRVAAVGFQRQTWRSLWTRIRLWTRWEFWPPFLFYAPVAVHYLGLAARYRSLTLPSSANPGMFSGGLVGESKCAIQSELQAGSPEFTAPAYRIDGPVADRRRTLNRIMQDHGLEYPVILKPDVGQRGMGVKLIRTPEQAAVYLDQTAAPLIVQRYVPDPHELGIFYYRMPDQPRGRILAITEKIFPVVVGDGRHTLEELVWRDERARFMAGKYLKRFPTRRSQVLPAGERLRLVEAGNHAQGCIFQDGAHLWSEALEQRIDAISRKLAGFYIGRYDLRYASEDKLRRGEGFQIIELNGAASEVTSIYDTKNSLTAAYRMLFRQWELVFAIGHLNRRAGIRPIEVKLLWQQWRQCTADAATYPAAD